MISAQSQDFARGLVQSYEVGIGPSVKRIGGSALQPAGSHPVR